jgi:hypothetical protein
LGKYVRPGLYKKCKHEYRFQWVSSSKSHTYYEGLSAVFDKSFSLKEQAIFRNMMYRCIAEQDTFMRWVDTFPYLPDGPDYTHLLEFHVCPVLLKTYSKMALDQLFINSKRPHIKYHIQKELLLRQLTGESPWVGIVRATHIRQEWF